jgi:hypothetical protein
MRIITFKYDISSFQFELPMGFINLDNGRKPSEKNNNNK